MGKRKRGKDKGKKVRDKPLMYVEVSLSLEKEGETQEGTFRMPITWRVNKQLTEIDCNPKEYLESRKEDLTDVDVIRIIHTGILAAGADPELWTEDDVGEAVIMGEMTHYAVVIGVYLAGFVTGGIPQELSVKKAEEMLGDIAKKIAATEDGERSETPTKSPSGPGDSPQEITGT